MQSLNEQRLLSLFHAAVSETHPERLLRGRLPSQPRGRTVVVGAGKSAAAMARAVEREWTSPLSGIVVTRYRHAVPCDRIEVVEAGHPLPDTNGLAATGRILALADQLGADDLLICLLSGGGSALLALPDRGVTLQDKRDVGQALLRCGAAIGELNCVRKHLSAVKGGRLAVAAHPAKVATYLISDVPGDDPSIVASGPTLPNVTTRIEALNILAKYEVDIPDGVSQRLLDNTEVNETEKARDQSFAADELVVLATAADALAAAARAAGEMGLTPIMLGSDLEGEARALGEEHARLALACARGTGRVQPPCVLLSGGETTVTVRGEGSGGRNCEYLLSLVETLAGHPGIWALACDTDGIDGTQDNAGAIAGPHTLAEASWVGLSPSKALAENDSYGFFAAVDSLVVTGPTLTNVNDFRAVLIDADSCG